MKVTPNNRKTNATPNQRQTYESMNKTFSIWKTIIHFVRNINKVGGTWIEDNEERGCDIKPFK